jgi:biopolymer transport protein TolR
MHLSRNGKGGDLNLVPYIDLLTCMIAFLLITAVWTQLARLPTRQHGSEGGEPVERTKVTVMVGEHGFNLMVAEQRQDLPRGGGGYDFAGLRTALDKVKAALPDLEDLQVASEDGIAFDTLVGTMDTALAAGFPALSLVGSASTGL